MKKIEAKIVADSINPQGNRITSFILTYPRFIHSELMTHRMFSRNAASSRAIPFEKMLKMVQEDPFIPIAWQKDHKGMQGVEYFTDPEQISNLEYVWKYHLNEAFCAANTLNKTAEVTKQICNRLLEPFMWYTVLVTATEYNNFFELRCPKYEYKGEIFKSKKDLINSYDFEMGFEEDYNYLKSLSNLDWIQLSKSGAEIHIQALAEVMWDAMNESTPKQLKADEWHIPFNGRGFITNLYGEDSYNSKISLNEIIKISTARCARLSYMTFDGEIDYKKDIKLHDQLLESRHMSPFEHCARSMSEDEYEKFIKGKANFYDNNIIGIEEEYQGWCNNFKGFIPYRYLIENNENI